MQVKLSIKKTIHQDYLNFLFDKNEKGEFLVTRNEDFGKMLTSMVKYSIHPIKNTDKDLIILKLPDSKPTVNASNYYLYFTKEDQCKLNDAIDVFFNIDFDSYYLQGKKLLMQQKDIIQSFIQSRKLVNLIGDNETLKKRRYRDELKTQKIYLDQLIAKAYYRHERIDKSLKEYN